MLCTTRSTVAGFGWLTSAVGLPHIPRTTSPSLPAIPPLMKTTVEPCGIAAHMLLTALISSWYVVLNARPTAASLTPTGPPDLSFRPNVLIAAGTTKSTTQQAARPARSPRGAPMRRSRPMSQPDAQTASRMKPGSTAGTSLRLPQG